MSSQRRVQIRGSVLGTQQDSPLTTTNYATVEEFKEALYKSGFEACELIVGVDFTKSNSWTGKESFEGRCLHDVNGSDNPYMQALCLIASALQCLDDDQKIPCYGFGDVTTGRNSVFSFDGNNEPAQGLKSLLKRYKQIVPEVCMSGPTTFVPLIRQAMKDVYNSGMKFHILLILADGQVSDECLQDTRQAIVEASKFPISIVMIGVGDGPWGNMQMFDDSVAERGWDNFQFLEFNQIIGGGSNGQGGRQGEEMYKKVLEEIPKQFANARKLVGQNNVNRVKSVINELRQQTVINPPGRLASCQE